MARAGVIDWTGMAVPLETKEYVTSLLYDGLNRVRKSIYPEDVESARKELIPTYNRAGALQAIEFDGTDYVRHIAYNAKGQRVLLAMGNGMMTRYAYDPITFRLQRIKTERYEEEDHEYEPQSGSTKQDSAYEYDLGGNILKIKERVTDCGIDGTLLGVDALDRLFQYDPLKRLLQATGRESDTQGNSNHWEEKPAPGSPNAEHTRAYTQSFQYDKVGNILLLDHDASGNSYNRYYRYTSGKNILEQIDDDGSPADVYATFEYDPCGNMTRSNTERYYEWDAADQLRYFKIDAGGGPSKEGHYLYAGGQRVKKFVRDDSGNAEVTIYIDGVFEHRYKNIPGSITPIQAHQNLLHVMDGRSRIATLRLGDDWGDPEPALCYNLEDHLGTSATRLNANGTTIDREEYYPFGDTCLRTMRKKRYRYVGKERDEESGLYYYGARYYAAWVGRFISIDPLATNYPHLNPYNYAGDRPIGSLDLDGLQTPSEPVAPTKPKGGTKQSTDTTLNAPLQLPPITGLDSPSTTPLGGLARPPGTVPENPIIDFVKEYFKDRTENITVIIDELKRDIDAAKNKANEAVQEAARVAITKIADHYNAENNNEWSKPASDDEVTAYQLFYQWVHGTGPDSRKFTEDSLMGQQMVKADYVQKAMYEAAKAAAHGDRSKVRFARQLKTENPFLYVADFTQDVRGDDAENPARGFHGSIGGTVEPGVAIPLENQMVMVPLVIRMSDRMSSESGTRASGQANGYDKDDPLAVFPGENPYGPNGQFRTIVITYEIHVTVLVRVPSLGYFYRPHRRW